MCKVAAVVVLYNPEINFIYNLLTYIDQVDKLYVIDNSDLRINKELVEKLKQYKKVEYISQGYNAGLASALNFAADKAVEEGFEYLLTMDEDGKAPEEMVARLVSIMHASSENGIVAAEHVNLKFQKVPSINTSEEVMFTMMNGNLLNLNAYSRSGKFLEKLFIDHLDHEYCLRLRANGYKITKTTFTFVYHELGSVTKKKFFNHYLFVTHHSPLRLYYRTRNRFLVNKIYKTKFPEYIKVDRQNMFRELLTIYFFENKLWDKTIMMLKGYLHYKLNKFGKYPDAG